MMSSSSLLSFVVLLVLRVNPTLAGCEELWGPEFPEGCQRTRPCIQDIETCEACITKDDCTLQGEQCFLLAFCARGQPEVDPLDLVPCDGDLCTFCAFVDSFGDYRCGCKEDGTSICPNFAVCTPGTYLEPDVVAGVCVTGAAFAPEPCFSKDVTVETKQSDLVSVAELRTGAEIRVNDETYEQVYGAGHWNAYSLTSFLKLETNSEIQQAALEISEEHLLFKQQLQLQQLEEGIPVRADHIRVGDQLLVTGETTTAVVTEISTVQKQGVYSPLVTGDGTFLANGVKVSSYTAAAGKDAPHYVLPYFLTHHFLSHVAISPFRVLCVAANNEKMCNDERNAEGQLLFASFGEQFMSRVLAQEKEGGMMLLFGVVLMGVVAFYSLEQMIIVATTTNVGIAMMMSLVMAILFFVTRNRRIKQ